MLRAGVAELIVATSWPTLPLEYCRPISLQASIAMPSLPDRGQWLDEAVRKFPESAGESPPVISLDVLRHVLLLYEGEERLLGRTRALLSAVGLPLLIHPLRGPITWACQRGLLSSRVRKILPWRWVLEPFTIYGTGWECRWSPTEFDTIGHRVFWSGLREWERETSPVILENIRRSRCFIDVGANCGIYTVLGCTVNSDVVVVAVEPSPKVCAALAHNVAQNNLDSRVTILNVALGESNGDVPFHEAEDSTMGSLAVGGYRGQPGRVIQVKCRTLDSIVEELNIEPDFLKIDVEGFEHLVLSGASRVLSRCRPRIVLEANPGDPSAAVTEILSKHGYGFQSITDRGLQRRSEIVPVEAFRNWFCEPTG
jgi:FkbM family methyltransferase